VVRAAYAREKDASRKLPAWVDDASAQLRSSYEWAQQEALDSCGVAPIYEIDVLVDAQDVDLKALKLTEEVHDDKATVTARFRNLGLPKVVTVDLIREGGVWRIDDVHPSGDSLSERIRDTIVAGDGC
jgi:hypothetical protein